MQIDYIKSRIKGTRKQIVHYQLMQKAMCGEIDTNDHDLAIIIKQIHAIEKGLSMENLRYGFGILRIEKMLSCLCHYAQNGGDMQADECIMAKSVLRKYITLHENANWNKADYCAIKEKILTFFPEDKENDYGGALVIHPNSLKLDQGAFETIVNSRHSIRSFKNEPVNDADLRKALELAMRAPSACNRQPVRVYVLDHSKFDVIQNWTGGVKTFIDSVDKLLIVTGQMAAFEDDEYYQYTVSAGIFTGYLTLALHTYGIGNCILQRALIRDASWEAVAKALSIPVNEQSVCAIAIGIPQDEVKVPVSHRLSYDRIVSYI